MDNRRQELLLSYLGVYLSNVSRTNDKEPGNLQFLINLNKPTHAYGGLFSNTLLETINMLKDKIKTESVHKTCFMNCYAILEIEGKNDYIKNKQTTVEQFKKDLLQFCNDNYIKMDSRKVDLNFFDPEKVSIAKGGFKGIPGYDNEFNSMPDGVKDLINLCRKPETAAPAGQIFLFDEARKILNAKANQFIAPGRTEQTQKFYDTQSKKFNEAVIKAEPSPSPQKR